MHGIEPTPMSSADELFQNGQIRPIFTPYIAYGSDLENPTQDYSYGSFSPRPRPSPANRDTPDNLQSYGDEEDGAESSKHEAEGNKRKWAVKELISNTKGDGRVHNNRKAEEEKKMYSATAPKYHISSGPNWASKSGSESPHALHYKQQKERAHQMTKKTQLPYRQGLWVCFGIHWKSMDAMVDV